jgi:hypothetical protein
VSEPVKFGLNYWAIKKLIKIEQKARATVQMLGEREYVVVGTKLPCDIHIPWEDRESLVELFTTA